MSCITTEDKLKEITREIKMRQRLYPRWVDAGKMSKEKANHALMIMQAVRQDYLDQMERETPSLPL